MLRSGLVALALMLPLPAFAADMAAPVKEIMAAATGNWQDLKPDAEEPPYVDYFSDDFLKRLYSRDFVAKYREAAKYPAYDDGGSPFAYDPIIGGQDGCALKDLTEGEPVANGTVTDVTVTFDTTYCFEENRPADWKPVTLVFHLIEEDGRAVIDDIDRANTEGSGSLKTELKEMAVAGAEGGEPEGGAGEEGQE